MRRAWKRSVIFGCAAVLWAPAASAFHAGDVFDKPPGAGGGGGLFYVGAAREHGWNCTACHTGGEGTIRVSLTADPPELLQTFQYEPGKSYALHAVLEGEHHGAGASNFNSVAVSVVAADGAPAGELSGYAADELYNGGATTIASAGQHPGENAWSFTWTAPADGVATLHLAAVDGDGAGGAAGGTLTDPFGDDVFTGALTFAPAGPARPQSHDARAAIVFAGLFFAFRRGGRR
jgi:hypothetical protein